MTDVRILMAFRTIGGALVTIPGTESNGWHRWTCQGCGAFDSSSVLSRVRTDANGHAGACRAVDLATVAVKESRS